MDATRFDAFTRRLATRLSRRGALRGGAGIAAGLLGLRAPGAATAAPAPNQRRYTAVRQYTSSAAGSDVKRALRDLLPGVEQIPGFVDYSVLDAAGDRFLTIAVFTDKAGLDQAGALEADWIAKQAKALLPEPPATATGSVILHAESSIGCPCTAGADNSCGSDQLVCCGDPGVCVSATTGCGPAATCLGPGEHCTDPSQCCQGYTCFEAVCDNPRGCFGPGDPCTAGTDCCEGSCSSDGRCYCTDPARPEIGCSCNASDTSACGGRPDLCCQGTCISPMASCSPPAGCVEPGQPCTDASQCCQGSCSPDGQCYCTDPSRPEIGCTCDAADSNACGGRPELCCNGACISPMANC